jgi:hypothetical protein
VVALTSRQLFLVTVVARPSHDTSEFERFGGAYVNCWADEPSEGAAISRATAEVRDSGWIPASISHSLAVTRDECGDDTRQHFDQALSDGVVLVFHTFPHEPEEGEEAH